MFYKAYLHSRRPILEKVPDLQRSTSECLRLAPPTKLKQHQYSPAPANNAFDGAQSDIFSSIEKLATLQSRGIVSEQGYTSKKAELLSRL